MTLIIIILIILAVIYFYYQRRKLTFNTDSSSPDFTNNQTELTQIKQTNQTLITFLRTNLNSNSLEELKSKLAEKTLDEILEENEDYETEIDNLTRTKNSLEADLLAQSNGFQNRLREKDREIKKTKEDLTSEQKRLQKSQENLVSEKAQHKGSLERISLLTQQISQLEQEKAQLNEQLKKMPGEFPQPEEAPKESSPELEKFIKWAENHEEFAKVDWDYYRSQEDWEKSFRKWNSLRADRISLLEEWKAKMEEKKDD